VSFYTSVFNTTVNPANLNKRSFAATMLRLFPDGSFPIFGLTSQTGKARAVSSTHGYFTKTLVFGSVQINQSTGSPTGYSPVDTTLVVDSTVGILPNMVLYNPTTRENLRVLTVASATQITVTRAFGRVAPVAIFDNQVLIVIGTAHAEGSDRPTARGMTVVHVPNFTQIFRNAWALTDTARASAIELGFTNISESRLDCSTLHSVDIESAILFGQAKMDTSGSQPLHATQGIIDAVTQYAPNNIATAGATTNMTQLIDILEEAWIYSHNMGDSKTRVAFCGSKAMKVFNEIARLNGTIQLLPDQSGFGFSFQRFKFYKGNLILMEHPILNGLTGMEDLAVGVDMPSLKLAYMEGRDTKAEEFGGTGRNNANGVDANGGSFTTEFAVELMNPSGCFVIYDLTAGAAG